MILIPVLAASPARAAMDRPTWSPGDFWVYDLRSGPSAGMVNGTIRMDVTGTEVVSVNGTGYSSYRVKAELRVPFGIFSIIIPVDLWFSTETLAIVKLTAAVNLTFGSTPNELDITVSGNPPQAILWPLSAGATWSSSTVVWSVTVASNGTTSTSSAPLTTDFLVEADQVVSVPAGNFTTTPVRQTNPLNASYSVNYWTASVGLWARVNFYNSTGQEESRLELTSFRYQGPGWFGFLTFGGSLFGIPLLIWLLVLVVVIVAVVAVARARRRRRPSRDTTPPSEQPPYWP